MKNKGLMPVSRAMLLLFTLFLASCGGQGGQTAKDSGSEPVSDPKLEIAYQRILVLPVGIGAQFAKDYPQAATDCRDGLLEELNGTKRFQVNPIDVVPAKTTIDPHTLVVKLEITDMRIVSKETRIREGAVVGSSYIKLKMTLIDRHTRKIIREKEFSTYNSAVGAAFAAAWSSGSIDDSIPKDMGRIIGDYIIAVVPQAGFPAK